MRAVQITAIGKNLEQIELKTPKPAAGEVLVAVKAAGICHSDAHYRSGVGSVAQLPITPGHEVAGVIASVGPGVGQHRVGERVCLHYLVTCGKCKFCRGDIGQFCPEAKMIGKDIDGGYAEFIVVPAPNAIPLPDEISFSVAAVMMCSFATALHAYRKVRFTRGESVAIFGAGGLGSAAIRIGRALGASKIIVIDINRAKVMQAESLGAIGIDASIGDVLEDIAEVTRGRGVDVALELVGLPITSIQAIRSLGVQGRAAIVGLSKANTEVNMYSDIIGKEREIVGVSDHLPSELDELIRLTRTGRLNIDSVVSDVVPLDAKSINRVFAKLDAYSSDAIRTVIVVDSE